MKTKDSRSANVITLAELKRTSITSFVFDNAYWCFVQNAVAATDGSLLCFNLDTETTRELIPSLQVESAEFTVVRETRA